MSGLRLHQQVIEAIKAKAFTDAELAEIREQLDWIASLKRYTNATKIRVGMRVKITNMNLRPRYLSGAEGVVEQVNITRAYMRVTDPNGRSRSFSIALIDLEPVETKTPVPA